MAMKTSDYPFFREIHPEAAVNCYTGSISNILKLYGEGIEEYAIWIVGNGFRFSEGVDDYGDPRISFDLIKTVDTFCKISGCSLNITKVEKENVRQQLMVLLKEKYITVWVNSRYLKYSDLYYSDTGYLHAIMLEKAISPNLIRIRDSLIVSTPAVSCIADFETELLIKAMVDNLETPELDVMGTLITLDTGSNSLKQIDNSFLIKCLYKNTEEIMSEYDNSDSTILKYHERFKKALNQADNDRKIRLFRRMNLIIKTLYVIPNRKLFLSILPALNLCKDDEAVLLQKLDNLINGWLILSNFCLKCSVYLDDNTFDSLEHYFSRAHEGEKSFWNSMREILKNYL